MKTGIRSAILLWLCWSFNAVAASDPVSWALVPATGFPATTVGEQSVVAYNLTNRLPFATRIVIDTKVTGGNFVLHDECHNKSLNPGKTCVVVVAFNPASTQRSTFQLTYGYDKNRIPLPVLAASGLKPRPPPHPTAHLHGVIRGLPATFNQNSTVDFEAIYTNAGTAPLTGCTYGNFLSAGVAVAGLTTDPSACPDTLQPGTSCKVNGTVTSGAATGFLNLRETASCAGPRAVSVTPKATAYVKASSGGCVVHAQVDFPLPTSTYKYADNVVRFKFENECTTPVALGPISITASGSTATITKAAYAASSTLNNCGASLAAGAECFISASVIPSGVGNLTVTASVTPTGKAITSAKTSAPVATNQQAQHHVVFINQCKFPVWYGIANGGDADCPGTTCKTKDPNLAGNPNGAPTSAYYLAPQTIGSAPSTIDLAVSSYQNGALWPRTGCTMQNGQFNCATGTCQTKNNSGTCLSPADGGLGPVQPQSPYTKIEGYIALLAGQDGVYDVSIINGMNVPVEMKAFGPSTGNTASTVYNCSAAGAVIQPASNNKLGKCSWNFNPQSTLTGLTGINSDFYWVTPGGTSGSTCPNGPTCGMSYSAYPQSEGTSPGRVNRHIGSFLAFNPLLNDTAYIADAQWGSRNLFDLYSMGVVISGQTPTNNYGTYLIKTGDSILLPGMQQAAYNVLLAVPGVTNTAALDSCYQVANTNFAHCGGCINWTNTLPAMPCGYGSPNYEPNQNLDWTTRPIAGPGGTYTPLQAISWLKNGCPTAYSYQYDDQASSFQCTQDNGVNLMTSYQVTFCPGGADSLPAGATEGRANGPTS